MKPITTATVIILLYGICFSNMGYMSCKKFIHFYVRNLLLHNVESVHAALRNRSLMDLTPFNWITEVQP